MTKATAQSVVGHGGGAWKFGFAEGINAPYRQVAQQCAAEGVDFPRYLLRLSELELLDRERRATERRIRQAKFDVVKSLDSFDFLAIPSLNKSLVLDLARGRRS